LNIGFKKKGPDTFRKPAESKSEVKTVKKKIRFLVPAPFQNSIQARTTLHGARFTSRMFLTLEHESNSRRNNINLKQTS
jgi:hypothetical protein